MFDGLRACLGLLVTLGPLFFLDVVPLLKLVFVVLGGIFILFALQVGAQSLSWIELSDRRIAIRGPIGKSMNWSDLSMLKLAHYTSARRSRQGWYRLSLYGAGETLRLESTIDGFDVIIAAARKAALSAGVALDPTTSENLTTLGY